MRNLNFKKFKKILKIKIIIVFVLISFLYYYNNIFSDTNHNMKGFAWGAEWIDLDSDEIKDPNEKAGGMGKLLFNCNDNNSCNISGSRNYGVNIDQDNYLRGFAWSPYYGWIKFGTDLAGFPTGGGTVSSPAKFVGTVTNGVYNGHLEGWARFCSPTENMLDCGNFSSNSFNGGWDGWVSLKGNVDEGSTYGVLVNNNILSGFAWGGDDAGRNFVGWIDFNDVNIGFLEDVLAFWAETSPVYDPNPNDNDYVSTTLKWKAIDDLGFDGCSASNSPPLPPSTLWEGPFGVLTGGNTGERIVNVVSNPTVYQITCTRGSDNYTKQVSVAINSDTESLSFSCSRIVEPGETTFTWKTTGNLTSCEASVLPLYDSNTWAGNRTPAGGTEDITIPQDDQFYLYKLSCTKGSNVYEKTLNLDNLDTLEQCSSSVWIKKPKYHEN